jgi:hypothetical protein
MTAVFHVLQKGNWKEDFMFHSKEMANVFHVSQQEKWQLCFMFHSKAGESSKQAM